MDNLSAEVLAVWVSIGAEVGGNENQSFLIAGESVTQISLMPFTTAYSFQYTFVPTQLGMLDLPGFNVSRARPERGKPVGQSDMKQLYLMSGFTKKVFVASY